MDFNEAMEIVNKRLWFGMKPGLERITALLERLDNPHKKLKFVHVAGTNGKGSCCALIASSLTQSGYKTGLYTSPYVHEFRERFRINGDMISQHELISTVQTVDKAATELERTGMEITEFEFITALAMHWFYISGCDIVVLEVGLGGRYDATNVIPVPEVAVIMSIDYDHTHILGNTLTEIATEKAGIIKQGGKTVMYPHQSPETLDVIMQTCQDKDNNLIVPDVGGISVQSEDITGTTLLIHDKKIKTPFLGEHQIYNALTAYTALRLLGIDDDNIKSGFLKAFMPARMQIINQNPITLLDGGHNPACAKALQGVLIKYLKDKEITMVVGMMRDKDVDKYLSILAPLCKKVITVMSNQERAISGKDLADIAKAYCNDSVASTSYADAARLALQDINEKSAIAVCGSFFIIDDMKREFEEFFKK